MSKRQIRMYVFIPHAHQGVKHCTRSGGVRQHGSETSPTRGTLHPVKRLAPASAGLSSRLAGRFAPGHSTLGSAQQERNRIQWLAPPAEPMLNPFAIHRELLGRIFE